MKGTESSVGLGRTLAPDAKVCNVVYNTKILSGLMVHIPEIVHMSWGHLQGNFKRLTVGARGLHYNSRKQKAGERMSRVECDTLLKQAAVPVPLTVCPWAHVALIAASTEPADCTHSACIKETKR